MHFTVWLAANCLYYPTGGGHLWVYLNWALGLKAAGCRVVWLEAVAPQVSLAENRSYLTALKSHLKPFGLDDQVALCAWDNKPLHADLTQKTVALDACEGADLLLNFQYRLHARVVERFRRTAFMDIDPGLLQLWMRDEGLPVAHHDVYFTIGETVGQPGSRIPDLGFKWQYAPPCVALDYWPVVQAPADAAFTTVSHWYSGGWVKDDGGAYCNHKRLGFLPFIELPKQARPPLELAIHLARHDQKERRRLEQRGWRVRPAQEVASNPAGYRRYIQNSLGEFSCAKPSCLRLQNAWISDRTICYLASGKPAIVQDTGPSKFLPRDAGLFRFRDPDEAVRFIGAAAGDYDRQCRLARELAEEHFDAHKIVISVLEQTVK